MNDEDDLESLMQGDQAVISRFNGEFRQGEHIAIIGRVGSGKSSFLLAILGEIPISDGELQIKTDCTIAYAEQTPLIVSGTI